MKHVDRSGIMGGLYSSYAREIVTIFFLSHVFFLVSVVRYPYFHFAPSHEETYHYLLAFLSYSSSFIVPL